MKIYLSSPFEHDRAATSWKKDALIWMRNIDPRVTIIDPCPDSCNETNFINRLKEEGDWLGFYSFCANIVEGDLAMLNNSEGMIAYLPHGAVTFGTTHEMIHSLQNNIPNVMVMPEGIDKVPHWLWGILGPNRIFDNLKLAAETLVKRIQVVRGEKLNDSVYYPGRVQI
jgi:hypothetical protein